MINATINSTLNKSVRSGGNVAKTSQKSASAPSAQVQKRENYLQTVEAGYMLHEPEIRGIRRMQANHERRIL